MNIRYYKSYTPGTRTRQLSAFSEITKTKPEKSLIKKNHRNKGRNNRGVITIRHRGGGHKKRYRIIDFKRNKYGVEGIVAAIEYLFNVTVIKVNTCRLPRKKKRVGKYIGWKPQYKKAIVTLSEGDVINLFTEN